MSVVTPVTPAPHAVVTHVLLDALSCTACAPAFQPYLLHCRSIRRRGRASARRTGPPSRPWARRPPSCRPAVSPGFRAGRGFGLGATGCFVLGLDPDTHHNYILRMHTESYPQCSCSPCRQGCSGHCGYEVCQVVQGVITSADCCVARLQPGVCNCCNVAACHLL